MRGLLVIVCLASMPRVAIAQVQTPPGAAGRTVRLDEIVAEVEGDPIAQSEVRAIVGLRLPVAGVVPTAATALDALINRRLMLIELSHFAPPDPTTDQVRARRQQWLDTLPPGTNVTADLARFGFADDAVLAWFKDELRIGAYVTSRFAAASRPTHDDLVAYFNAHAAEFAVNGVTPAFEAVQDAVTARVTAIRRDDSVREWIAQVRARADVWINRESD